MRAFTRLSLHWPTEAGRWCAHVNFLGLGYKDWRLITKIVFYAKEELPRASGNFFESRCHTLASGA
jgi:hypothetical protein